MNIPVTLCINGVNIPINATVTLPDQYRYVPFQVKSPLELSCDLDLKQPTAHMDNVYLIHEEQNFYKIGMSKRPNVRSKSLQTGNHRPLEVIACCPGGKLLETRLQQMFEKQRLTESSAKEWFYLSDEDVSTIKHIMFVKHFTSKFSEDSLFDCGLAQKSPTVENLSKCQNFPIAPRPPGVISNSEMSILRPSCPRINDDFPKCDNSPIKLHSPILINSVKTSTNSKMPRLPTIKLHPSESINSVKTSINSKIFLLAPSDTWINNNINYVELQKGSYTKKQLITILDKIGISPLVFDHSTKIDGTLATTRIRDFNSEDIQVSDLQNLLLCVLNCADNKPENCTCQHLKDALHLLGLSTEGDKLELIDRFLLNFNKFSPFIDIGGLHHYYYYSCKKLKIILNYYRLSPYGNSDDLTDRLLNYLKI